MVICCVIYPQKQTQSVRFVLFFKENLHSLVNFMQDFLIFRFKIYFFQFWQQIRVQNQFFNVVFRSIVCDQEIQGLKDFMIGLIGIEEKILKLGKLLNKMVKIRFWWENWRIEGICVWDFIIFDKVFRFGIFWV